MKDRSVELVGTKIKLRRDGLLGSIAHPEEETGTKIIFDGERLALTQALTLSSARASEATHTI